MPRYRWSDDAPASASNVHPSGSAYGWGPSVVNNTSFGPGLYEQRQDFGSGWHGPPQGAPRHVYAIGAHLLTPQEVASPAIIPLRPADQPQIDRKAA